MTLSFPSSRHQSKRGFNLIEAAIVLAIVGAVIGGIWSATAAVMQKHRVSQTLEGFFSIAQQINQQFGRIAITTNCNFLACRVDFTNAQKQAMITPPAGWNFNADGTLDSPIFSNIFITVATSNGGSEDSNVIAMWTPWPPTNSVNESDCKAFGIEAIKSLSRGNVAWSEVDSDDFYVMGYYENGAYEWSTDTDSGHGLPDPLLAAHVEGCFFGEIDIMRE